MPKIKEYLVYIHRNMTEYGHKSFKNVLHSLTMYISGARTDWIGYLLESKISPLLISCIKADNNEIKRICLTIVAGISKGNPSQVDVLIKSGVLETLVDMLNTTELVV